MSFRPSVRLAMEIKRPCRRTFREGWENCSGLKHSIHSLHGNEPSNDHEASTVVRMSGLRKLERHRGRPTLEW
jgi:hypothetical protein